MTETLVVSKEHDAIFRETCKQEKIVFELVGEGVDGDTYMVTFNHASELYYLGRFVQLAIANDKAINILKNMTGLTQ